MHADKTKDAPAKRLKNRFLPGRQQKIRVNPRVSFDGTHAEVRVLDGDYAQTFSHWRLAAER